MAYLLFLIFDTDLGAGHKVERPDILADAILVDSDLAGFEIDDEMAVRIAHGDVQEYFTDGTADDDGVR
ncbi:MAG: hypothetical protein ABSF64_05980 [Bryobacteraceae bacterium]